MLGLRDCGVIVEENKFIVLERDGICCEIEPPVFPLDVNAGIPRLAGVEEKPFGDGGVEGLVKYRMGPVYLHVQLRAFKHSPVVRLRYSIAGGARFSGRDGIQCIEYLSARLSSGSYTYVELGHFDRLLYCYTPNKKTVYPEDYHASDFAGPILFINKKDACIYMAYEHGAAMPDHYLKYNFDGKDRFSLRSAKGNYYGGQQVEDYRTPWFQIGITGGSERKMMESIRNYYLYDINENHEPARPYLYYNSWGHQFQEHQFNGNPYLQRLKEENLLKEIDMCHKIGIEVFVIDAGWFERSGDYDVSPSRFPKGLKAVRESVEKYGMKLGLWYEPTSIGLNSKAYREHPEFWDTFHGEHVYQGILWETEESYKACLASGYSDLFIEKSVENYSEYGVTYTKWDGIHHYNCDAAGHWHGTEENSPEERHHCFAYRMGLEMIRIAEEIGRRCPGAIVDFDVTESQRFFGLGFLGAGKYFYCNYSNFYPRKEDFQRDISKESELNEVIRYNALMSQAYRQSLKFDELIPSSLFLTHFAPNGPLKAQNNALASVVLAGNGIWGNIIEMGAEDIERFSEFIRDYKDVRNAVTRAYPRVYGFIGSSPEIHEKIDANTAEGLISFFTNESAEITYITQAVNAERLGEVKGAKSWRLLEDNRLEICVSLPVNDACTVFIKKKE